MTSTGSTGDSAPGQRSTGSVELNQQHTKQQHVSVPGKLSAPEPNLKHTLKTFSDWHNAFKTPTEVKVLSAQALPPDPNQALKIITNRDVIFLLEVSDGVNTFQLKSRTPYPVGSTLSIQLQNHTQLVIVDQHNTMNELLTLLQRDRGETLRNPPQLARQVADTMVQVFNSAKNEPQPPKTIIRAINQFIQHTTVLKNTLEQNTLSPQHLSAKNIADKVINSGLFFESKLLSFTGSEQSPSVQQNIHTHNSSPGAGHIHSDYKAILLQVLRTSLALYSHMEPRAETLRAIPQPLNTITDQPMATNSAQQAQPAIQKRFDNMLQSLLLNAQLNGAREAPDNAQQSLTNMYALATFLSFLSQLSHSAPRTAATSMLDTGWNTLFNLLFGTPEIFAGARSNKTTKSTPKQMLKELIQQIQGQLTRLSAKQMALISQQEQHGEKKTLAQLELCIALGEHVMQVPLTISENKDKHNKRDKEQGSKSWQIQLGFDLGPLGLMRTLALYSPGSLELTFQVQEPSTQTLIAQHTPMLQKPLAKWGITVERIHYQPFQEVPFSPSNENKDGFQFIHIEL